MKYVVPFIYYCMCPPAKVQLFFFFDWNFNNFVLLKNTIILPLEVIISTHAFLMLFCNLYVHFPGWVWVFFGNTFPVSIVKV